MINFTRISRVAKVLPTQLRVFLWTRVVMSMKKWHVQQSTFRAVSTSIDVPESTVIATLSLSIEKLFPSIAAPLRPNATGRSCRDYVAVFPNRVCPGELRRHPPYYLVVVATPNRRRTLNLLFIDSLPPRGGFYNC